MRGMHMLLCCCCATVLVRLCSGCARAGRGGSNYLCWRWAQEHTAMFAAADLLSLLGLLHDLLPCCCYAAPICLHHGHELVTMKSNDHPWGRFTSCTPLNVLPTLRILSTFLDSSSWRGARGMPLTIRPRCPFIKTPRTCMDPWHRCVNKKVRGV